MGDHSVNYIRNSEYFLFLRFIVFMGVNFSTPDTMSSAVTNAIRQRIAQSTVVIYSKTHCPYCMAKEVFDKIRQPYDVIELNRESDGDSIQDALGQMTGARTVPRVFIKGQCIGGGTETKNLYKSGKLEQMLN